MDDGHSAAVVEWIADGPFAGLREDEVIDCPICLGSGDGEPVRSYRCPETGWEDAGPPPCRYCGGCGEVLARVESERAACLAATPWAVAS